MSWPFQSTKHGTSGCGISAPRSSFCGCWRCEVLFSEMSSDVHSSQGRHLPSIGISPRDQYFFECPKYLSFVERQSPLSTAPVKLGCSTFAEAWQFRV